MKLGFVSAILDQSSFEEMIDTASDLGYECVEVACWPNGKAERRYAGVSHIDVDNLSDEKAACILDYCKKKQVEISALAFYPNTMDGDLEKRAANIAHLKGDLCFQEAGRKSGDYFYRKRSEQIRRGQHGAVPGNLAGYYSFC